MPGIPYVLDHVKDILSIMYARNTFKISKIVCTEIIKRNSMPGNLGLWV